MSPKRNKPILKSGNPLSALRSIPGFAPRLLLSLSTGVCVGFGYHLEHQEQSTPMLALAHFLLAFVVCFIVTTALFSRANATNDHKEAVSFVHPKRFCLIFFFVLILSWTPILLAGWPGYFSYDVGNQVWLSQTTQYENGALNSHHPILHTIFLGATMQLGQSLFGSYEAGVCFHCVIQAILLAGLFTFSLFQMIQLGLSKKGTLISCAYWALDPIIGMFAYCTTKDVLFSGLLFQYAMLVTKLFASQRRPTPATWIAITLTCAVALMLRSNAIISIGLAAPIITLLAQKSRRVPFLASTALSFALAFTWLSPITTAMGAQPSPIGIWNALCIPEQQIAYCLNSERVEKTDKDRITQLLPGMQYREQLSDLARGAFLERDLAERLAEYGTAAFSMSPNPPDKEVISLYLDLGFKYPLCYALATAWQTEYAWNPFAPIYVYPELEGADTFQFRAMPPVHQHSYIPALTEILQTISFSMDFNKTPLLGLIVSIPFYCFILLLALIKTLVFRQRTYLQSVIVLALMALGNLFGPCMLIRYFLYLFFSLPFLMQIILAPANATQR